MNNIKDVLEREVLPLVSKPGRYIGGEVGAVVKTGQAVEVRIALAFPDVYEIGMSHLGLRILYSIINANPRFAAERVFAPWPDTEARMRERGLPLYGLESFSPLSEFDLVGFSLQHELTYTNILTMLDLGGIPLFAREREERSEKKKDLTTPPLVIAGGPGAYNPAPLEEFIDVFVIGDGEEALPELMEEVGEWKRRRPGAPLHRGEFLEHLASRVRGLYIPRLYKKSYAPDGRLISCEPIHAGIPRRVTRRAVKALRSSRWLKSVPVPTIETVHDRVAMEIRRGCGQGCRFCQAGMVYRPVRDEAPAEICSAASEALCGTGYDEVALCALSVGDYPRLDELAGSILKIKGAGPLSLSLPSLRPDRLSGALARRLSAGRRSGITLAPEAGTESMRRAINKKISMDDLLGFVAALHEQGWRVVKLYFMVGLPGETEEDLRGIIDTIRGVADLGGRGKGKWEVNVTVAYFIPKPHTPLQWDPMEDVQGLRHARDFLRREVRRRNVALKFHGLEASLLEAAFSRGDRPLGNVLYRAWRAGCRFDGWSETFNFERWRDAFAQAEIDPLLYARRRCADEECLPWDVIDIGVRREFLLAEREKYARRERTGDCVSEGCRGCGVCPSLGMEPIAAGERSLTSGAR